MVLLPGCYLIIAQDRESFLESFGGCPAPVESLSGSWLRLNDGEGSPEADEIFICSSDGTVMESAAYPGMIRGEKGRSIERLSPELCSTSESGIWLRCGDTAGSTPGKENYCRTGVIPQSGVAVYPDPFRPDRDGSVRFTAAAAVNEEAYSARVFDLHGREIARLASGPIGAAAVSFAWDGTDERGDRTGTGLYICVLEFMCGGGGVCRREKVTLTVWAGR